MSDRQVIFGKRAVAEALRSGVPVKCIYIAQGAEQDGTLAEIERRAEAQSVKVKRVSKAEIERICEGAGSKGDSSHQGVVAEASPYRYATVEDILANAAADSEAHDGRALAVVIDHVTDAGNLGAIIRSAESVGAGGVIIPNKRAAQVTPITYKTSAGAVSHMSIAMVPNVKRALEQLKDAGFWVVAATEHADDVVWDTDMTGRIALVLGNEQEGISELVLKASDFRCKLPQVGSISSLNVAQASTVFMYEWLRQNS